ncbi:hypothetical protein ACFPRL_22085 [Pseudoclavibacter helvolus]
MRRFLCEQRAGLREGTHAETQSKGRVQTRKQLHPQGFFRPRRAPRSCWRRRRCQWQPALGE